MRTSLILLTSLLFLSESGIAQELEWIRQFDTAGFERADAVAVDGSSVYAAGHTTGTFPGETKVGTFDGFLRKYDTDGNELWTRQFGLVGPTNRPIPQGIATDETGVYVAGYVFDPFSRPRFFGFVRKYDPAGHLVWTRLVSAINHTNQIWAISADASGVYVAGNRSDLSVGLAAFVTKYDAAGTELWTRLIDSTNTDVADAVCVDGNGVYVAGRAAAPLPGQSHVSGFDPFVRKYDLDGNEVWTRQFGTTSHFESAEAVSVQGNDVYVVGRTSEPLPGQTRSGGVDAFVRKYDIDGNEFWTRQFHITSGFSQSVGGSADATGVYLAGRTSISLPGQTNLGANDAFVRKYDVDGDEAWTRQFGSALTDRGTSVADEVGKIYVAGITLGVLPGQVTTNSLADAFVVKLFQVPVADAGPDQNAVVGGVVQLDGSESFDPDGDPISFSWQFMSQPTGSVAELTEPATSSPTFAPDVAGDYVVQLVVSDGTNDSDPDQVTITAQTPAEAIQDLIDQVGNLVAADLLPDGPSTALIKILEAAMRQLDRGNNTAAAQQLHAFNLLVMALIDTGALSLAEGQSLIDAANKVINAVS